MSEAGRLLREYARQRAELGEGRVVLGPVAAPRLEPSDVAPPVAPQPAPAP